MNNITLNYLIEKHKLNANRSSGTDKVRRHSYIDVYESLFASKRNENLTILEIGTDKGGTLYLWCKAASEDATIVSILIGLIHQSQKNLETSRTF